jgi:hypothetical protein
MDPLQNQNSNPVPAPEPVSPTPTPNPAPVVPPVTPVNPAPAPTPVAPVEVPQAPEPSSVMPPVSAPTYVPAVETSSHKELRLILPAMLVLLLLAGGYALYKNMAATPETTFVPAANNENVDTNNPVNVGEDTQVAVAKSAAPSSAPTLPEGWPSWIPVERGSLKESSKIYYESQTTVLYSASYTTTKTQADIWSQMSAAATKEGFSLDKSIRMLIRLMVCI